MLDVKSFFFFRQELERLDKLQGMFKVQEVMFKAEKREADNKYESRSLTDEEWELELASMMPGERREMEKFLRERGDIQIVESPIVAVPHQEGGYKICRTQRSWKVQVHGVGTLFLPLRRGRLDVGPRTILVEPSVEGGRLKLSTKTLLKRVTTSKGKAMLVSFFCQKYEDF